MVGKIRRDAISEFVNINTETYTNQTTQIYAVNLFITIKPMPQRPQPNTTRKIYTTNMIV